MTRSEGRRVVFTGCARFLLRAGLIESYREWAFGTAGLAQLGVPDKVLARQCERETKHIRAAADPARHIRTPEAHAADVKVLAWLKDGDHAAVVDFWPEYAQHAPEGYFGHYFTMLGALGGRDCTAAGTQFGEYESVSGTGQAHIWFDL